MSTGIDFNSHLIIIEEKLKKVLREQNCELICDIDPTEEEFETFSKVLNTKINGKFEHLSYLLRNFPTCMVCHAVFQNIFGQNDDFWPSWSERLGVDIPSKKQHEVGEALIKELGKLGYPNKAEHNRIYVEPIRNQAGIPRYCLGDVFDVVDSAATDLFDPMRLTEEIATSKSYQVNEPVKRMARQYIDRMVDLLLDIRCKCQPIFEPRANQYLSHFC